MHQRNDKNKSREAGLLASQEGVMAILVAVGVLMLFGFAALAIDIGHLAIVQNELKNASDAGALAGARVLYVDDGKVINTGANQEGHDTAVANMSEKLPVEVNWTAGNSGDVQRGHWSFATQTFTPNASTDTDVLDKLWQKTTEELDLDTDFINAVQVAARREATPAASFFARIFGYQGFTRGRSSVAYLGFAGSLGPGEVDQPIAVCEQRLLINGDYSCSIGRMLNNSSDPATSETAMWTNFNVGCTDSADNNDVSTIIEPQRDVCGGGNAGPITFGSDLSTTNGVLQDSLSALRDVCWANAWVDHDDNDQTPDVSIDRDGDGVPDYTWPLTLVVIDCQSPGCNDVVGAVTVNVVWISGEGEDPQYKDVPVLMDNWSCVLPHPSTQEQRIACWDSFVAHFSLQNVDGTAAPYDNKSLYFKPDCEAQVPRGRTGGRNFGILARIPSLVQ